MVDYAVGPQTCGRRFASLWWGAGSGSALKWHPSNHCSGSGMFILDPNFSILHLGSRLKNFGSRIRIKKFSKNCSKLSKNYLGCSSQIPDFGSGIFSIPDQGVKSTWSRIRIRNTASPVRSTHPQPWFVHSLLSLVQEVIVPERRRDRVFTDFDLEYFWQWTDFTSYVECVMTIAALGETTYLKKKNMFSMLCIRLQLGKGIRIQIRDAAVKENMEKIDILYFMVYQLIEVIFFYTNMLREIVRRCSIFCYIRYLVFPRSHRHVNCKGGCVRCDLLSSPIDIATLIFTNSLKPDT